jgi:negative regulator of sigma-B (phosphoserine phosphatase)
MTAVLNGGRIERHGGLVTWGIASVPLAPESQSGDLCVVWSPEDGALIAVLDGAGHGSEAAEAARLAAGVVDSYTHESPVALVLRCHERLRGTRGAAMTLASLNLRDRTMTWIGIGNVEAVLYRATEERDAERVLLRSGVVGYRLPARLKAEVVPLQDQDTLIIATDGLRPEFAEDLALDGEPNVLASRLLTQYGNHRDDALVVVVKYQQGGEV